ncbi:MAG: CBS domain-containing protein [Conexibacter sp.]
MREAGDASRGGRRMPHVVSTSHSGGATQEEQMCKTAREFVTGVGECVSEYETVLEGARKLADFGVDTLPICGEDRSVLGMLSERDVVRIVAERRDPDAVRVGRLMAGEVTVVDADAPIDTAWSKMVEHDLVRMPVIDDGRLIGMLRRTDLNGRVGEGTLAADPLATHAVASI